MAVSRSKIDEALRSLPKPGGGGYHTRLLGVANVLAAADMDPAEAVKAIRQHTPPGTRHVFDREIEQAVEKAYREKNRGGGAMLPVRRRPAQPKFDAAGFMAHLQRQAAGWGIADLLAASPVPLRAGGKPEEDAIRLLDALYKPDDLIYCGEKVYDKRTPNVADKLIRRAADWIAAWRKGEPVPPHIVPNPLTGKWGKAKDERPSLRADSCVRAFRFAIVEFDKLSTDEQVRFWAAVDLPVCALVDSGGKSIHGWIRIDGVSDAAGWSKLVEDRLFPLLIPLGSDASCRNESHLSRLPGHRRAETKRWQRLLYLAPEGRRVMQLNAVEALERQIVVTGMRQSAGGSDRGRGK